MKSLILALLLTATASYAGENKLGIGLFTEHYQSDDKDYNENNRLISYTYVSESNYTLGAASFENSHFIDSQAVSVGYEFDGDYGVELAAVKGYESKLKTHFEGLIFIPIFYVETYGFRHTILGPVYNLSYVFQF